MPDESETVSKSFADFMVENQRQHGELAERISQLEARLAWRMMAVGGTAFAAMAALIITAVRFLTPTPA